MLNEEMRSVLNDPSLIAKRDKWFSTMQNLFETGEPRHMRLWGSKGCAVHPEYLYTEPEKWVEEVLENLASRVSEANDDNIFVPLTVYGEIYGVHYIDKLFGAEIFESHGQIYNRYLQTKIGELQKPDLEHDETWMLAKRIAEAFLAADVKLPLFAPPILSSALNIAVNLYGEEILVAMLEEPEAASHDLQIINEVIMDQHRWYIEHIPSALLQPICPHIRTQPPGYGQICGCTSQLMSPDLYENFILPLDNAVLGVHKHGGMIHLCGSHRQLIPSFARMENLKSLQLNDRAAEDLLYYAEGLREDQVIYLHPCKNMMPERALQLAPNRRIVIVSKW